ncbi:MAG: hypothetical protein M5U01_28255 [Ardenticatenaceae bacterium]|nr:hypothetical protein [Ardenticatenaceae bacterium]
MSEVMAEAPLYGGADSPVKQMTGCTQHVMDNGGCFGSRGVIGPDALRLYGPVALAPLFCLAFGTFSAAATARASLRARHAHHLVGDSVRFLLVGILRLSDAQLGLKERARRDRRALQHLPLALFPATGALAPSGGADARALDSWTIDDPRL